MTKYYSIFQKQIEPVVASLLPETYIPDRIRDNKVIRDAIWGFNLYFRHEINIINSPLIQRLRYIFQTSLALFTYPSAVHSRFEHSLGVTALSHRILESVDRKLALRQQQPISRERWAEVRLAGLLHDCGHGPFSHGSEEYFGVNPLFECLKRERPEIFAEAAPHEILSYFITKSKALEKFWRRVVRLYRDDDNFCELPSVSLERVALMILGKTVSGDEDFEYLSQAINGPFDADKLDYLSRDGYFTGLQLQIDIERLLLSMDIWREDARTVLCVDISGVSALEQLLFSKMQIFHSVYHHHKVRAALHSLFELFDLMADCHQDLPIDLRDKTRKDEDRRCYPNPFAFLRLDDYDVLGSCTLLPKCDARLSEKIGNAVRSLKNRLLLKRAVVLALGTLDGPNALAEFASLRDRKNKTKVEALRRVIANETRQALHDIILDIPPEPGFEKISLVAQVRLSEQSVVPLEDAFPTRGWVTGYAQYKYKAYLFCRPNVREEVAKKARIILAQRGIALNDKALEQAKLK
jgi:HD superfamily phosphohydrolase